MLELFMELFILIMIFVLVLCLGSFVNMLVYRTAVKYELISPPLPRLRKGESRSFCDYCGKQLHWYENIPVISWFLQKGKSKCCHKKLPVQYPIVELITGGLMVLVFNKFNLLSGRFPLPIELMQLFWLLLIVILLVFLTVFDFKYMILPDFAVITLITVSFLGVIFDEPNIIPYLVSAIVGSGFLLILYLITKKKGIGFGDVKLAIFMGLFLGWPKIILAMYIAFITGAVIGVIGIFLKKINKKSQIAFGPFLILGTVIAWLWGKQILSLSVFQIFR